MKGFGGVTCIQMMSFFEFSQNFVLYRVEFLLITFEGIVDKIEATI